MVTTKNLVHAALYLTVVLAGAAGVYILLAAEFVAVTQVLVYIGAIVVLMLFGLFLTRAPLGQAQDLDNDQRWLAAFVALLLFGVLGRHLAEGFQGHPRDAQPHRRRGQQHRRASGSPSSTTSSSPSKWPRSCCWPLWSAPS